MTFYEATGVLRYGPEEYRLVAEVDQEISDFYKSLIPKWIPVIRPSWPAHITVVRVGLEMPQHLEHWGKHDGEVVQLWYEPFIHFAKIHFWLNMYSVRLEEIREELGLPLTSWRDPPPGFRKRFHMTVATLREK